MCRVKSSLPDAQGISVAKHCSCLKKLKSLWQLIVVRQKKLTKEKQKEKQVFLFIYFKFLYLFILNLYFLLFGYTAWPIGS